MTFGSGLVAIVAGLVASGLASTFGFVAPFDLSLLLLGCGGIVIFTMWGENYGERSATALPATMNGGSSDGPHGSATTALSSLSRVVQQLSHSFEHFGKAWRLLASNERVLLLGLVQSCFEASMYIFVFMWTPALESSQKLENGTSTASLPHGVVFAMFMVCIMIGSKLFEIITSGDKRPVEDIARWIFVVSGCALAVPIVFVDWHHAQLVAFCLFEVCCGLYFPSAGTMRSKYIPEEVRSTVMNVFRIGLNLIVVLTLVNIDGLAQSTVFLFTVVLLTLAIVCQHRLFALSRQNTSAADRANSSLTPEEITPGALSTKEDLSL
jgi:hypothetical protein